MLTEEEKQRIILEEKFRNKIKKELETKPSGKLNILKFLNSNFGSFMLSTVIVGGISFAYNLHQESLDKIEKERIEIQINETKKGKLFTELAHRLATLKTLKDSLKVYQSKDIYLAYHGSSIGNDPSINATFYNFKSYYPEFSEFSALKVLDELISVDKINNYSDLRNRIINVNSDIVNLGQSWYYQINSRKSLPKGVEIYFNKVRRTHYYKIEGKPVDLKPGDTFLKIFFIGNSISIKDLVKEIDRTLNDTNNS